MDNNLYVKLEKCEFLQTLVKFMGYILNENGFKVEKSKMKIFITTLFEGSGL